MTPRRITAAPPVDWTRILVINTMATALFFPLSGGLEDLAWSRALHHLAITAVYVFTIGTAAGIISPRVVRRFDGRRPVVQLAVRLTTSFTVLAVGVAAVPALLLALGLIDTADYMTIALLLYWPAYAWAAMVVVIVSISLHEWMRRDLEAKLRTAERDEAVARQLATEAQLAALEARVRPHFLFNALNSIAALIPSDPSRAERMVGHVSSLLRSSLDSERASLVPLGDELRVVGHYLEIERVRFGDRLRYRLDVDDGATGLPIPRLAVQTLVENAVKYAVSPRSEGGSISVHAKAEGHGARISVSDDGGGFDDIAIRPGHGLALLRARLQMLFGAGAALNIQSRPGLTTVTIEIHDSCVPG